MPQLVAFRALQGIGAGGLVPIALSTVGGLVPPRDRGRYQGLIGATFAAAAIAGPPLGGLIADNASWRWIFIVNLPLGVIAFCAIAVAMPQEATRREHSIDWLGAAALAAGTASLLLALVWGGHQYPWSSAEVVGAFVGAGVLLVTFALIERRVPETILPFGILRGRTAAVGTAALFLIGMTILGTVVYVPLFVQGVLGGSATSSGVIVIPFMLGAVIASVSPVGGSREAAATRSSPSPVSQCWPRASRSSGGWTRRPARLRWRATRSSPGSGSASRCRC